ncbi:hypothetical protein [Shimia sp.]|uniref:hypothetical protein n=1 Tax=Shimia sp. TaxID=1954381 RepID=UPI00329A6453
MSNSENISQDAARALEILEQAYAYYAQPSKVVNKGQARQENETYFEYVKAA